MIELQSYYFALTSSKEESRNKDIQCCTTIAFIWSSKSRPKIHSQVFCHGYWRIKWPSDWTGHGDGCFQQSVSSFWYSLPIHLSSGDTYDQRTSHSDPRTAPVSSSFQRTNLNTSPTFSLLVFYFVVSANLGEIFPDRLEPAVDFQHCLSEFSIGLDFIIIDRISMRV